LKSHRWVLLGAAVTVALAVPGAAAAPGNAPAAPINDDYLLSLELNGPDTKLNSTSTLKDVRNTTGATVQSNIFNPCGQSSCPQGPAEVTTCNGVTYGDTIWYDFYPQAAGQVSIRTSGFDNVITLYRFNTQTLVPDSADRVCVHQSSFPSEQLVAPVKKGLAYTIQVGGVNATGGLLQFLFDYFITPPHRLSAQSSLTATDSGTGDKLLGLSVSTTRAARVEVDCGRYCRRQSKSGSAVESFPQLKGVDMPAGSKLQIRVTAHNSIGVFIQYDIVGGARVFTKLTRCTEPGSRTPRRKCH
jgi:hypothetical protein